MNRPANDRTRTCDVAPRGKSRHRAALLVTLATLGLVASPLVSSYSASASSKTVMKPAAIAAVLSQDYAINNRANATLNLTLQASHEQGTSLLMDDTAFRIAHVSAERTLDGPRYYPFYGHAVSSSLPAQSSYPAQFASLVAQSSPANTPVADRVCPGSGDLLVDQKNTSSSPWRVTLEPYVPVLSAVPAFAHQTSGYGEFTSRDALAVNPKSVPGEVVAALNAEAASGRGSALLPVSDFAYAHCGDMGLANPHSNVGVFRGLEHSCVVTTLSPSDLASYAIVGGGALVAFSVQEHYSELPAGTSQYIEWTHGTNVWWNLLPVGHYAKVAWTFDQQLAVVVPAAKSGAPLRVVGATSGVTSVTGAP